MACGECGGKGRIWLLTRWVPCTACAASAAAAPVSAALSSAAASSAWPTPAPMPVPRAYGAYDRQDFLDAYATARALVGELQWHTTADFFFGVMWPLEYPFPVVSISHMKCAFLGLPVVLNSRFCPPGADCAIGVCDIFGSGDVRFTGYICKKPIQGVP